jgi:hypothetical protein
MSEAVSKGKAVSEGKIRDHGHIPKKYPEVLTLGVRVKCLLLG